MTARLRIGIVVGEASGDILGAALMNSLRKRFPDAEFCGIGGPRMLALGFESFFPQDRLAVMGLVEPLKRLPELLRIRRFLIEHFIENPPAVFIGVDSPDFNLTIEEKLKAVGIATVHYVSPSVWAWRQKRIVKIARSVDLMLTLLPFEAEFYQKNHVPVEFVGHHLADEIPLDIDQKAAREQFHIPENARVIALLPGSRHNEVEMLGELFLQTASLCFKRDPSLRFIIPAANTDRYRQLHLLLDDYAELPIQLVQGQSQQVMIAADALLIASGTTALEAMLLKRPMVIAYRLAWMSWAILSRMIKTPFVGLPNLLAGRLMVPELLQDNATPEKMTDALMHYFDFPEQAETLKLEFYRMHEQLRRDASERAADAVAALVRARQAIAETEHA